MTTAMTTEVCIFEEDAWFEGGEHYLYLARKGIVGVLIPKREPTQLIPLPGRLE